MGDLGSQASRSFGDGSFERHRYQIRADFNLNPHHISTVRLRPRSQIFFLQSTGSALPIKPFALSRRVSMGCSAVFQKWWHWHFSFFPPTTDCPQYPNFVTRSLQAGQKYLLGVMPAGAPQATESIQVLFSPAIDS